MQSTTYRNYRISYHFTSGKWSAHVYRPSSPIIMRNGIIDATAEEGEGVLLERVHAMIDEAETLLPPLPPTKA